MSFYLSLRVPGKGAPSMFPNRVPMGSDTPSPEPLVYFSFFHSFIHVCLLESPERSPRIYIWVKIGHHHRTPRRHKAYIQWRVVWFPKGIVMTLLSLPQRHAAFGVIPSTLAWVDQSPISQHVSWQPPSGYTLHNCYCLPRDLG